METREIAPNVYWVGYVDWNVRDFHGYKTHAGTTYNAYLVVDEKIALIDAVKGKHGDSLLEHVGSVVDPGRIDYVISNHTEPDHSGEILTVLKAAPQAEVLASEKGALGLKKYYPGDWKLRTVKTGDSLDLGKTRLEFINTPMLHWPDSMFTYMPDRKLLFSMDAFGQHLATSGRFDTDNDMTVVMAEAKTYYANIIMHLGSIVAKTLKAAGQMDIEMICPSHGVIWTKHIPDIVAKYEKWAQCQATDKVLVIYDSMWHSTEMMAEAVADGAAAEDVTVKLLRLTANDLTMIVTEILDAAAVAVGSPTLNNTLMPTVAGFLAYVKGLRPKNKLGLTFGSYGWSGGGAEEAAEILKARGFEMFGESITCQYRPDEHTLEQCRNTGRDLARRIKETVSLAEKGALA